MKSHSTAGRKAVYAFAMLAALVITIASMHYPMDFDSVAVRSSVLDRPDYKSFYQRIYSKTAELPPHSIDPSYGYDVIVADFVRRYGLEGAHVLEVGAGAGKLQDVVADYTGLDISPESKRLFHKPFVEASATSIPFKDEEFDAIWTINVLEHVPKPEQALAEMRRVIKDNGLLYLQVAWHVRPWAAQGYGDRPYRDFDLKGKLVKASIPVRDFVGYRALYTLPIRAARLASRLTSGGPTTFRYTILTPNYEKYWGPDSDAINSMDPYEAVLWFTSRGDDIVSHDGVMNPFFVRTGTLIIRVRKPASLRAPG